MATVMAVPKFVIGEIVFVRFPWSQRPQQATITRVMDRGRDRFSYRVNTLGIAGVLVNEIEITRRDTARTYKKR